MSMRYQKLLIHLAAARSAIDSACIALEDLMGTPGCDHPDGYRLDVSTMGMKSWICDPKKGGCGHEFQMPIKQWKAMQEQERIGGKNDGNQDDP